MKKLIATAVVAAGIGAGAVLFGSVMPVGATGWATAATATADAGAWQRGSLVSGALAKLVADGTITQAQADAVAAALKSAVAGHPLAGHPVLRTRVVDEAFETAASTVGVSVDDLRAAVRSGMSIADVATQHGVDPSAVVDALVTSAGERLDAAVQDGRLPQAAADKVKAQVPAMADKFVHATGAGAVTAPPAPGG